MYNFKVPYMITQKNDELTIVFDIQGLTEYSNNLNPNYFFNIDDPCKPEKTKPCTAPRCKPKRHGYIFMSPGWYKQDESYQERKKEKNKRKFSKKYHKKNILNNIFTKIHPPKATLPNQTKNFMPDKRIQTYQAQDTVNQQILPNPTKNCEPGKRISKYQDQNIVNTHILRQCQKQSIDPNNIKKIKILDIRHSNPNDGHSDSNIYIKNIVNSINNYFPNVEKTKIISTVCHSECFDSTSDLREDLFNIVQQDNWNKKNQIELQMSPFNEINTRFITKKNRHGEDKIKIQYRYKNAGTILDQQNRQYSNDINDKLKFMHQQQIYKFRKNNNEAQIAYCVRDLEPEPNSLNNYLQQENASDDVVAYEQMEKNKTTLQDYTNIENMKNFLANRYDECQQNLHYVCQQLNTKVEDFCVSRNIKGYYSKNIKEHGSNYANEWLEDKKRQYVHTQSMFLPRKIQSPVKLKKPNNNPIGFYKQNDFNLSNYQFNNNDINLN